MRGRAQRRPQKSKAIEVLHEADATGTGADQTERINPRDIELRLYPSRATIELGEAWECLLRIENHSDRSFWITGLTTTLTLPAEIRHPSSLRVSAACAQLPTVPGEGFDSVMIAPRSHYIVLWRMNERPDRMRSAPLWRRWQWHIFFHPGRYDVHAHAHFWPNQPDTTVLAGPVGFLLNLNGALELAGCSVEPRKEVPEACKTSDPPEAAPKGLLTAATGSELSEKLAQAKAGQSNVLNASTVATTTGAVEVVTKSSTVLVAAAVGGLAAFLLRELFLSVEFPERLAAKDLFLLPSYALTSIITTLFISRVTEARVPLTIKIMDFWGAVALGILAALAGQALLNRLLNFL